MRNLYSFSVHFYVACLLCCVFTFSPYVRPAFAQIPADQVKITLDLKAMQIDYASPENDLSYWMFDNDIDPFQEKLLGTGVYSGSGITWNPDGTGDGTCGSLGSGQISTGFIINPNTNLPDNDELTDQSIYTLKFEGFVLRDFRHINVVRASDPWDVFGQAGDTRLYENGTLEIYKLAQVVYRAYDIAWSYNMSYPSEAGPNPPNVLSLLSAMVGKIDLNATDPLWLADFNPEGNDIFFARTLLEGSAFAPSCYGWANYQLLMQPYIPPGPPPSYRIESSPEVVQAAQALATTGVVGVSAVMAFAGAMAATVTAVTIGAGIAGGSAAGAVGPPGAGAPNVIQAAGFLAVYGNMRGTNFSTGFTNMTEGLEMFIMRGGTLFDEDPPPVDPNATAIVRAWPIIRSYVKSTTAMQWVLRQEVNPDDDFNPSITPSEFKFASFIAGCILCGFIVIHSIVALLVHRSPGATRDFSFAWLLYLEMMAFAIVFEGAVLASIQYLISYVGTPYGQRELYALAAVQLLIIGLGGIIFMMYIVFTAMRAIKVNRIAFLERGNCRDPEERKSKVSKGKYETAEDNHFHNRFAIYYDAISGPLVWYVLLDFVILVFQILFIGLVEDGTVVLIIILMTLCILFMIALIMRPFLDLIEQILVCLDILCNLVMTILAIVALNVDEDKANNLNTAMIAMGWTGLAVMLSLAIYTDIRTLVEMLVEYISEVCCCCCQEDEEEDDETVSQISLGKLSGVESDDYELHADNSDVESDDFALKDKNE